MPWKHQGECRAYAAFSEEPHRFCSLVWEPPTIWEVSARPFIRLGQKLADTLHYRTTRQLTRWRFRHTPAWERKIAGEEYDV